MADAPSPATSKKSPIGTKLFAPQVRLVDPSAAQSSADKLAGAPVTMGVHPVSQDISKVIVTEKINEVSTVEIVLNNVRLTGTKPLVPAWRYNGLRDASGSGIGFGTRLRVDMRYGQDRWVPIILARITDIDFTFPSATPAQVTLHGEDLLSLLKIKPKKSIPPYNPGADKKKAKHEAEIVDAELADSGTGLTRVTPSPGEPSDKPFKQPLQVTVTHKADQTYFDFIKSLADRMDFEFFIDFSDSSAKEAKFHFVPTRSAQKPDSTDKAISLLWGRDIIDFTPKLKVWDIFTGGRRGNNTKDRPSQQKGAAPPEPIKTASAINDLWPSPNGQNPAQPMDAVALRQQQFGKETGLQNDGLDNITTVDVSDIEKDDERANAAVNAALRRSARGFLTADITVMGMPGLRPGIHVDLSGFDAPFDGVYYVTQTVHTLSDKTGYTTKISVRRPGMLDPSSYSGK